MKVTEGISGMWHYHISEDSDTSRSLCGRLVMPTSIKIEDWAKPFGAHFPKQPTFCDKCSSLRIQNVQTK